MSLAHLMPFGDPPLTPEEEGQLADIPPYAREAFYRSIKFHWYANVALGTFVGWTIEYAAFGLDAGWLYILPMLIMALIVHRMKWNRTTDIGALSKAKLAMRPDWPEWKRERDYWAELAAIRERNPARDGAELDDLERTRSEPMPSEWEPEPNNPEVNRCL